VTAPTLTEFLLARIARDEDEARHARPHSGGSVYANDVHGRLLVQPARVLAECEAKRRIVESHRWDEEWENGVRFASDCEDCWQSPPCRTLRALAAVYADHPDYDEAWRAEG